ncbi:MAG: hypothetical protein V4632_02725 [Pseudomonadota bacterium]
MKSTWNWLRAFFLNYLWLGITILLVSILLEKSYPEQTRIYWLSIAIKLIEGIGISILIASIFTFASGTSEFIEKIKSLLEDIVVRREFLANMDPESKKEAIKALIQPSVSEKNKYPNIGDYYGYFIDKTLEIKEKSVRSNYAINARAFFCTEKKLIAIEGIYTYRLYPSADGFNDIILGFEDKDSFCSLVTVSDPEGKRTTFEKPELTHFNENGDVSYRATIQVKDFANGKNHIDVELRLTEFGTDHWKLIQFKALQPTDGFRFHLHCDGEIRIQEHAIFVVGATYHLEVPEGKQSITFTCNQWVNEGTGFCALISVPVTENILTQFNKVLDLKALPVIDETEIIEIH